MKKAKKVTYVLLLVIFFFLSFSSVKTADGVDFNPHFIISDIELQDWQSMNRADIQAFLESYPGILAKLCIPDVNGEEKPASDIIYQAAQEYKINPKYIIVKLQKEQSLITDATPSQKQLDWATGYAVCDGCYLSDPDVQKHKGFGNQVDSAAGIMRWYYEHIGSPIIKKPNSEYLIDGLTVKPLTFATAFLYTYTPHLNGNKNFWTLYQKWFEQVYPNGTLLKTAHDPTVYLVQNGKKRPFTSLSALVTRFDPKNVIIASGTELAHYPVGNQISLTNYSILKYENTFYLLDNDSIRPFTNYEVVKKMGYQPEEIVEVSSTDLVSFTIGPAITLETKEPVGRIVKVKENKGLYYIKDNIYYPIPNPELLKTNFPNFSVETSTAAELNQLRMGQPVKFRDGTLFGESDFNKIYVIENGLKRHIPNEQVFNGLGYDWNNIIWVDLFTTENYPDGQALYLRPNLITTSTPSIDDIYDADVIEPGKMITTPSEKTKYLGKKFETNMDVYLVAEYKTGKILVGKNINVVRPMASFAKVMTSYRLLREGLKLTQASTYNETKHKSTYHKFRIVNGEKIKNEDLMKSMLVSSINTAAKILACQLGTEKEFVKRMNKQAKNWGLNKTIFTDSYGFDLGNKTTASEFLKIFTQAMTNSTLVKIMGLRHYIYNEVVDKDKRPKHFDDNSNLLVNKRNLGFNIIASKTGYLDEAGAELVMLVERPRDKKKFIIITMGNPDYVNRFNEPEKLTSWALTNF